MSDPPVTTPAADGGDGAQVSTGIGGLDDVLAGGLLRDRLYLVEGTPGTGKTTLALQFLLEGRRRGEGCLLVTLSETARELRSWAATHGWSLDGISILELELDAAAGSEREQTLLHPAELELGETMAVILERIDRDRPKRLVLDNLSELRLLAQTPLRFRRQIFALKARFASHGCTVLLLDERANDAQGRQLHTIVHGVIVLEQSSSRYGAERRSLHVVKMRGIAFRGGVHDYAIKTGGISVYPRLVAPKSGAVFSPVSAGTGVAELDTLLGGGLMYGASTLLMGPTGTGKTSTAIRCILAALDRGERAAVFMFDEEVGSLLARSKGLGMDLPQHLDSGRLQIRHVKPAELSPGELVQHVRDAVEIDGVRTLLIDSLNGYLHAMPDEHYLVLQMHELLGYLSQHGVLTLLILGQHGLVGGIGSDVDLSYLSDTIILLRYFEAQGGVRRGLSVIKTRTSSHETTIREFSLGGEGLTIGAILHDFDGVLNAMPVYRGQTDALLGTSPSPPAGLYAG